MANWDILGSSGSIDDRRGTSGALLGGGAGIIGIVLFFALNYFGIQVDPSLINSALEATGTSETQQQPTEYQGADAYERFASTVLGTTTEYWSPQFAASGTTYTPPKLVLFRGATRSACGVASSQVGPHYCPYDETIYLDETFFETLTQLGGSSDDVAQAYVIAHEVGHHVQNKLGTMARVMNSGDYQRTGENSLAVRLELQADCYSGLWANSLRDRNVFAPDEIKEAMSAAEAVGDDRIQESMQGQINPETWTHGSSEQRLTAFTKGYESGNPTTCQL